MSREDYEVYDFLKDERKKEGQSNRQKAKDDFKEASTLAAQNGLRLSKCDGGVRYRLEKLKVWIKDIYPGNSRIYCPNQDKKGPFLQLPLEWTLLDVVKAAIAKENEAKIVTDQGNGGPAVVPINYGGSDF